MLAALDGRRETRKQPAVGGHRGRNAAPYRKFVGCWGLGVLRARIVGVTFLSRFGPAGPFMQC